MKESENKAGGYIQMNKGFTLFIVLINIFLSSCDKKEDVSKTILRVQIFASFKELELYNEFAKEYEIKYPDIEIRMERFETSDKLNAEMAGDSAPDIFSGQLAYDAISYGERGIALDLLQLIKEDKEFDLKEFFPEIIKSYLYKDKLYGIPYQFSPVLLFYNKDLFDEAKIKYPDETWTWDTFVFTGKQLMEILNNKKECKIYGFSITKWWFNILPIIWSYGGNILNDNNTECIINSENTVRALEFFNTLINKHHIMPTIAEAQSVATDTKGSGYQSFNIGRAGMTFGFRLNESLPFNWDVAPIPKKGNKRCTTIISNSYSIYSKTKHLKESWEFLKYLTSSEMQNNISKKGRYPLLPTRKAVAQNMDYNLVKHDKLFLESIKYARVIPAVPEFNEMDNIITKNLDLVWLGNKPVKEVCDNIKIKIDKLLKTKIKTKE